MSLSRNQCIEWINALRSGEYKQGRRWLYTPATDSYCCLGVLAKINNLPTNTPSLTPSFHRPINLSTYLGEFTETGNLKMMNIDFKDTFYTSLTSLNDSEKYSFSDIADLLESQYLPQLTD